ncbi:hypothetical protein BX666DRAFT_1865123, partial [Dichotomocladium elegans]
AITSVIDNDTFATVNELPEHLRDCFRNLQLSQRAIYALMTKHCNLFTKKAAYLPVNRNRLEWVKPWEKTVMNFLNCAPLDEAGFHIEPRQPLFWMSLLYPT